jgi:hypothetical protein
MKNLFKAALIVAMSAVVFTAHAQNSRKEARQANREARQAEREAAKKPDVVIEETVIIIEEPAKQEEAKVPGMPQITEEQKNKALQMVIEEGNKLFDRLKFNDEQRGQFTSLVIKHLQDAQKVYMPDGKFVQQPNMIEDVMKRLGAFDEDAKKMMSAEQFAEFQKYKTEKMQQAMQMMQNRGGGNNGGGFGGFGGFTGGF